MAEMNSVGAAASSGNLEQALATAKTDLVTLRASYQEALAGQEAADKERLRVLGVQNKLTREIVELNQELRKETIQTFKRICSGAPVSKEIFRDVDRLTLERKHTNDSLLYCVAFPLNDAIIGILDSNLRERLAFAAVEEARATRARLKLMLGASSILEYDSNAKLDISEAWSAKVMEAVDHLHRVEIPIIKKALADAIDLAERERALTRLF